MSIPKRPDPAKLVVGVFLKEKALFKPVTETLLGKFGTADLISPWFPFDYTDYYKSEMGDPLFRRMIAFIPLIRQGDLAEIKRDTNDIELQFAEDEHRRVNIDPGYLLQAQFVLATGKNYSHRIYIGRGIYADLTLMFANGEFSALPWTYPDYADTFMKEYLLQVRKKYVRDLRSHSGQKEGRDIEPMGEGDR